MGFLLILTENHNHPTSHLLLITQVIGSEALVEVTSPPSPAQQSDGLLGQQDPGRGKRVSWEAVGGWSGGALCLQPGAHQIGPQQPGFPQGYYDSPPQAT